MKELKTENYLKKGNFKYDYRPNVLFSDIDLKASRENTARLTTAIDEDRVTKYGIEMLDGVEFPAIVLLDLPPGGPFKWIIATGVHRSEGAVEAGKKGFDAYCVTEPDAYRREVLFKQLNTLEGHGVTMPEQVQLAIQLHLTYNITLRQLAKEWNLKEQALKTALGVWRARQRAYKHKWDFEKARFPQRTYISLNRIQSDVTYNAATEFVFSHRPSPSQVDDLVGEILKTKSEAEAAAVTQRFREAAAREEAQKTARIARLPTAPATKMLSAAKSFIKHLDGGIENLFLASLTDRTRALDILQILIDRAWDVKQAIQHIERITPQSDAAE